jgi:hypothetical protein
MTFLKHTSAVEMPHSRRDDAPLTVGATLDDFRDLMELYCWRLCGAEVCLGMASDDQEFILPDCVFGTLDEGFEEDP